MATTVPSESADCGDTSTRRQETTPPLVIKIAENAAAADLAAEGSVAAIATAACSTSSMCDRAARIDATFLTLADRELIQHCAQQKAAKLSSVSAIDRKMRVLASQHGTESSSAPTYTMVDLHMVNSLLNEHSACQVCRDQLTIEWDTHEYGVVVKLKLHCSNCGEVGSKWSSQQVGGSSNCNPFEINVRTARAFQSTGNGQTALNDIFAAIGVSHQGLHTKTYQEYLKMKLHPAATRACAEHLTKCATVVKCLYKDLNFSNPENIAVSFDGSWHTRTRTSHIGIATVIVFSAYVLDYVVLSNFGLGCECGPKPESPEYSEWKAKYSCQKNTSCKPGQMEAEAAMI